MANKEAREYLMTLIDEAERIVSSDPLAEDMAILAYTLKENEKSKEAANTEISSCHACEGFLSRTVYPRPILRKNSRAMFIMAFPDGNLILEGSRIEAFRKWWQDTLLLAEGEWSLTSIIKCPVSSFDSAFADSCKNYLREEMNEYAPHSLIILGREAASYMLRRNGAITDFMNKKFTINHIPTYVSPSLEEYASNPSLRKAIWNNFLYIRSMI